MNKIKVFVLSALLVLVMVAGAFAAANPFADVPTNHWAYDACGQLAARGLVSGYPSGYFRGDKPLTRYEMSSVVARTLAYVDTKKVDKQDLELLKKLVMEFKDELDALGVRVDALDKRVAVLEDRVGGWKINGSFRFDAKFGSGDDPSAFNANGERNDFSTERFDLYLTKYIDDKTFFYAHYRTGNDEGGDINERGDYTGVWREMYVNTVLLWNVDARIGRFNIDFEAEKQLYADNDALFGDFRADGFRFKKSFGTKLDVTGVVVRNVTSDYISRRDIDVDDNNFMTYALDAQWNFSEYAMIGATGYWFVDDSNSVDELGFNTFGIYGNVNLNPNIAVKGIYYFQNLDVNWNGWNGQTVPENNFEDTPKAWKAILDVKQDALKVTSLWVEYSQQDGNFKGINDRYSIGGSGYDYVGRNVGGNDTNAKFWFVKAEQQWGESKFRTFLRYAYCDPDNGYSDENEWGVGVGYQYTPAVAFELAYDSVDHGDNVPTNSYAGKNNVVRFRTVVNF